MMIKPDIDFYGAYIPFPTCITLSQFNIIWSQGRLNIDGLFNAVGG